MPHPGHVLVDTVTTIVQLPFALVPVTFHHAHRGLQVLAKLPLRLVNKSRIRLPATCSHCRSYDNKIDGTEAFAVSRFCGCVFHADCARVLSLVDPIDNQPDGSWKCPCCGVSASSSIDASLPQSQATYIVPLQQSGLRQILLIPTRPVKWVIGALTPNDGDRLRPLIGSTAHATVADPRALSDELASLREKLNRNERVVDALLWVAVFAGAEVDIIEVDGERRIMVTEGETCMPIETWGAPFGSSSTGQVEQTKLIV